MTPKGSLDFYCPGCERKTRHDYIPKSESDVDHIIQEAFCQPIGMPNYFGYQCTGGVTQLFQF